MLSSRISNLCVLDLSTSFSLDHAAICGAIELLVCVLVQAFFVVAIDDLLKRSPKLWLLFAFLKCSVAAFSWFWEKNTTSCPLDNRIRLFPRRLQSSLVNLTVSSQKTHDSSISEF